MRKTESTDNSEREENNFFIFFPNKNNSFL